MQCSPKGRGRVNLTGRAKAAARNEGRWPRGGPSRTNASTRHVRQLTFPAGFARRQKAATNAAHETSAHGQSPNVS
jgi:hypothetical protein